MTVELDLVKAYNLLNWDYIKAVLTTFGFYDHQLKLIMDCITSTSSSVLINGKAHGYFYPIRGIRQDPEDPLSPNIFILCMELLIRQLNNVVVTLKTHVGLLNYFSSWF